MALNNPAALYFDGVDDRVVVPNNAALNFGTGPFSIEMIAIPQNFPAAGKSVALLSKRIIGGPTDGYPGLSLVITTSKKFVLNTNTATFVQVPSLDTVTLGELYYLAGTRDEQGKLSFYVNGVKNGEAQGAINFNNNGDLWLGDDNRDNYNTPYRGNQFKGYIDNVRIWNRCLSEAEIKAYKDRYLTGTEEGLVAFWRLDEGSGNIAYSSSSTLNGTIYGATWTDGLIDLDLHKPGEVKTGSITFRGRSSMSLAGIKRATGSITFRGQSSTFLSAVKTAVGKITFRGGSFMSLIGLVLRELEGVYQISSSEIVSRNQPVLSTDLANYIEVWINPRVPADQAEEVYRSKEPEPIPPGESKAFNLKLDKEPVIEAVASLEEAGANLTITDTKFYSGSAEITVTNTGTTEQTCIIVIQAKPLELQGRRKIVVKDEESILDHGLVKYTFDSPLVQDEASARDIGKKILWLFSVARANIEIEWRGDPALELADPVQIPEFEKLGVSKKENFYVVRQLLEVVEGGLDATLSGRKIPRLKEGD